MTLKSPDDLSPSQFSYDLPEERIALFPAEKRDHSRLLIRKKNGSLDHDIFKNIATYLPEDSHVYFNNSKVIPARLIFTKETGSHIELLCLNPVEPCDYALSLSATRSCIWECMVGNLKRFRNGSLGMKLEVSGHNIMLKAEKISQAGNIALIRFSWDNDAVSFAGVLSKAGQTPLPPYIKRDVTGPDREWYQTVYSKYDGSVAAPTAGLHFTEDVFGQLRNKCIHCHELTLHIGAGTFQPMKSKPVRNHIMHAEWFRVTTDLIHTLAEMDTRVTCVGTSSLRALESLYWLGVKIIETGDLLPDRLHIEQWEVYDLPGRYSMKQSFAAFRDWINKQDVNELIASTKLMIIPGYEFRVADALITNFHQPQSTLLLLIAAFIGESWKDVYHFALDHGFRFLSYGDSSLLFQ